MLSVTLTPDGCTHERLYNRRRVCWHAHRAGRVAQEERLKMVEPRECTEPIRLDAFSAMCARLQDLLRDGLRHGFFEYSISCETGPSKRRFVMIRAGKSERFVIPEEALT